MKPTCNICKADSDIEDNLCHDCQGLFRWVQGYYSHDDKALRKITPTTSFRDLSTGSLDWADWLTEIEEKLRVKLPDQTLDGIHTIGDLIRELRNIGATWPDELDLRLLPRHCCSAYLWEIIPKAK